MYGAVVLIIIVFLLFSAGTWAIEKGCTHVQNWDRNRMESLKKDTHLDTIRYSMIIHKINNKEYPSKMNRDLLRSIVQKTFMQAVIVNQFEVIQYEKYKSYNGPSFKMILRDIKSGQLFNVASFQVGPKN